MEDTAKEPSTFRPVTHVIFDLDGLLLNTEIFYTEVLDDLCGKYGKKFTWELKHQMMGRKERDSAQFAIDALGLPISVDEYIAHVREELNRLLPTSRFMPGAEKLVKHLYEHGVTMAIATGSDSFTFRKKTTNHGDFLQMFTHYVLSGDDPQVRNGKPFPDIFLVCASRFPTKVNPEDILVFEDALNGVKAAVAAGMQVVAVPDERADLSEFSDATLILKSLLDFRPEAFGLPAFGS
ncbi:pseudouridine-5'-phosphatase-like [Paramacrobiotus metropolitanus]|uniref:pseudouridine-5'-phosphatase-like n=1 Tax=Paramacrobiotus metropolitanus TaxID=2943436 RepID=UPI002445E132|nr:pseudouridine-5'-phosphatase-like [Paramacrobiotus metropolitanus]